MVNDTKDQAALVLIAELIDFGWQPDAEKIERLKNVMRNREPSEKQNSGPSAKRRSRQR